MHNPLFPKWIANPGIAIYFSVLAVVSLYFGKYALPWWWMLFGSIEVLGFFYGAQELTRTWGRMRDSRKYEQNLFLWAFFIRLAYVLLNVFIIHQIYGPDDYFGFENADATLYDQLGKEWAQSMRDGKWDWNSVFKYVDFSDTGYATYLGFVYLFTGDSIVVARVIKCFWSALTAVLMYRLARNNFGEAVGRMTGIFVMLMPNFWYYCGAHLKETEMVFLSTFYIYMADNLIRSRQFTAWRIIPLLLVAFVLFSIRTPLALVCILALIFALVMTSARVMGWGKRIIIIVLALGLLSVTMGNRIQEEARQLVEKVQGGYQAGNMEWRSNRKGGNTLAKYANAAVFAPMIFTIPFPTMVDTEGQYTQKLIHGGNFTKNILSGFVLLSMFVFLFSGTWRDHTLVIGYMLGYLVVLTVSAFAHSERFHQPVLPFELMFAAYMICNIQPTHKRWFKIWTAVMAVGCLAWQWFKLKGRGLA